LSSSYALGDGRAWDQYSVLVVGGGRVSGRGLSRGRRRDIISFALPPLSHSSFPVAPYSHLALVHHAPDAHLRDGNDVWIVCQCSQESTRENGRWDHNRFDRCAHQENRRDD
ncbi:hypothetical protein PMAYCL1PPCAC_11908, partial [Pristionchus mayeri]